MRRRKGGEASTSFYRVVGEVNGQEAFSWRRSASSLLSMHQFLGGEATGWLRLREYMGGDPWPRAESLAGGRVERWQPVVAVLARSRG
jgi:hypothetical protein